jgi:hypothetical protein
LAQNQASVKRQPTTSKVQLSPRQSLVDQWQAEISRYRNAGLVLTPVQAQEFFDEAERALAALRLPLEGR